MNINCTMGCSYQKDGKCFLEQTDTTYCITGIENTQCPYFKAKNPNKNLRQ